MNISPPLMMAPWWQHKIQALLEIGQQQATYVYHLPTVAEKIKKLQSMRSIEHLFYAIKANPHPKILAQVEASGAGFECVSLNEVLHVFKTCPNLSPQKIIFTPNFAPQEEYAKALELGVHLTIDSLYPLEHWSNLLKDQSIFLRIDPGFGAGHHAHVKTGGEASKFGLSITQLEKALQLCQQFNIQLKGLHAHTGSGIFTPETWQNTAQQLCTINQKLQTPILNLGGGLGVQDSAQTQSISLEKLDEALTLVHQQCQSTQFWLEPGRYIVAESGVLLTCVTQTKTKGERLFIGVDTGMNSLIRPSLYEAYHPIINLSKLHQPNTCVAEIVGPICESGDTLGHNRPMPETEEGDILLIDIAGAYGHVMSSNYNLRPPAIEVVLQD